MTQQKNVAVITGGASGIGRAICEKLATLNYLVIVSDIDASTAMPLAKQIRGQYISCDLNDSLQCKALIHQIKDEHGRVDVLVNNGGFQHVSPIEKFPEDQWNKLIAVMLTAPFILTKAVWPLMRKQRYGRIINIASVHSQVASLYKAGYISAKHGVIGLTKTCALEGGPHGITVNAISPAYVRTPLVEAQIASQAKHLDISTDSVVRDVMLKHSAMDQMIEPQEIAEMVAYLCSDSAKNITGSNFNIDGGWTSQ